jgi:hypothetical protein
MSRRVTVAPGEGIRCEYVKIGKGWGARLYVRGTHVATVSTPDERTTKSQALEAAAAWGRSHFARQYKRR